MKKTFTGKELARALFPFLYNALDIPVDDRPDIEELLEEIGPVSECTYAIDDLWKKFDTLKEAALTFGVVKKDVDFRDARESTSLDPIKVLVAAFITIAYGTYSCSDRIMIAPTQVIHHFRVCDDCKTYLLSVILYAYFNTLNGANAYEELARRKEEYHKSNALERIHTENEEQDVIIKTAMGRMNHELAEAFMEHCSERFPRSGPPASDEELEETVGEFLALHGNELLTVD